MSFKLIQIIIFIFFLFTSLIVVTPTIFANENNDTIIIYYYRFDNKYDFWSLWIWDENGNSFELQKSEITNYGAKFILDTSKLKFTNQIGILPKFKEWEHKDDPNRYINLNSIQNGNKFFYIVSGIDDVFDKLPDFKPFIKNAFLDKENEIIIVLSHKICYHKLKKLEFKITHLNKNQNLKINSAILIDDLGNEIIKNNNECDYSNLNTNEYNNNFYTDITLTNRLFNNNITLKNKCEAISNLIKINLIDSIKYNFCEGPPPKIYVQISGFKPNYVKLRKVLYSSDFYYDGELGYIYSKDHTIFRVFAPTAEKVEVLIYDSYESKIPKTYLMERERNGVFSVKINGNLLKKYYKYKTTIDGNTYYALDPYSKCNTSHNGLALIIDDKTEIADSPYFTIDNAIIYELHIRDFTIDEKTTTKNKGKFLGLCEENTTHTIYKNISTGINHLKELGINTVQIMPIFDFENDENSDTYNWGYMPVNFNSPDGWYATKIFDDKRVIECKKMIDIFHKNNIKVVLDVVYNHTAETNEKVKYNFNALAPNYYYRTKLNGDYWNGSGCGNEFKSESPMGRKFIIDSLKYWVINYKIDGFRFDLMGLIDTETLDIIVKELKKIKPDIFIYGEPWAASNSEIQIFTKGMQKDKNIAVFNDHFRDAIKGSVWDDKGGYIQGMGDILKIEHGVIGSIFDFTNSPLETINYCEAHDNRTLYDTIIYKTKLDPIKDKDIIKKMHKLACFLVLTSQGIPFLHAGQEFMRSKFGEDNSYNKPDEINKVRWDLKIENYDVFEFTKNLITLRNNHPMFKMTNSNDILQNIKFFKKDLNIPVLPQCLAYMINRGNLNDSWKSAIVLINPYNKNVRFKLPDGKWKIYYLNDNFYFDNLKECSNTIKLNPISAAILYSN